MLEVNELKKLIHLQSKDIEKLTNAVEKLEGKLETYEYNRKNKIYILFLIFFYFFSVITSVLFIKY